MNVVAVTIIILHSLTGAEISVNPEAIVSMRDGQHTGQHVAKEVECVITTADGKFISVLETCAEVRALIEHRGGKQ